MTNTKTKTFSRDATQRLWKTKNDGLTRLASLDIIAAMIRSIFTATNLKTMDRRISNYMAILDELKRLGYTDVLPLEKLLYTDGKTYEFPHGKYFACHKENDTESSIFNSKLEKLGIEARDSVTLRIENAASHNPSEWSVRREKTKTTSVCQQFNTKKIRAALRASDAGIQITEYCGIVPVFKYDPPSSFVSHYEIEMKDMRDRLISANKFEIEQLPEIWLPIKYSNGGRRGRKNQWTAAHHEVVSRYEMRNTDGAIRNKETKKILGANTSMLRGMVGVTMIQVGVERHRAYAYTFMEHKRRDQDCVDHIDGDHANNAPWNLRWVSAADNCLAKHTAMTERIVPDMVALHDTHGAPLDPKMWNGWTFHSNMWITRPDKKTEFVAFSTEGTYPRIGASLKDENGKIEKRNIQCHQIIAYLYRVPTSELASDHLETTLGKCRDHFQTFDGTNFEYVQELKSCGLVIMHDDDDKSNYSFENLTIGTRSENGKARHANPETTSRKRVDILDTTTRKRIRTCDSQITAAEWLKRCKTKISKDVCINRTREIGSYRVTTHKLTGVAYYVVDAA